MRLTLPNMSIVITSTPCLCSLFPPTQTQSVSAGCADLRLTTATNRQTLVNTQSARVVNLAAVGTIKRMYAVLATLQLTVHPDKRYIGKTEKGFDFLGYRFRPQKLLEPAVQSLTRLIERSHRLHEKGADSHRLRQYVQRWVMWLHGGLHGLVKQNRFNQIWDYVNLKLSG